MNLELSDEAVEFGRQARRAFEAAGGDRLVQDAEAKPSERAAVVEPVLADLGAWELEPRADADSLEAAAALCRSAGYWAVPYPVAERLAGDLVVVDEDRPEAALVGVENCWTAVTVSGARYRVTDIEPAGSAFVGTLTLERTDDDDAGLALALVLPCWTLLGMLDRAIDLTVAHVSVRKQFDQPLSGFQGVQFQLTDAEVERSGVDVLAKYALWTLRVDDALALRMAALEAAEVVFRVCHQLHGATGFCDETTLSWLSRHSQPLRRLPFGLSTTRALLTRRSGAAGLTGLYIP